MKNKPPARPVPIRTQNGDLLYYRVWSPYPYPHYTGYFITQAAAQSAADRINAKAAPEAQNDK